MRTLIIKIVFLAILLPVVINCQDSDPSNLRFNYIINGDSIINQPLSREYFQQKKFMLGTQWGGHPRMLKALKMNSNQNWKPRIGWPNSDIDSPANPADSMKYIWYGSEFYECSAFSFKPTLYIPENKRGELIIQSSDSMKSIFGFSYIRDINQIKNNPTNTRFNLYKDSINYIDSVVLSKVWLDNGYKLNDDPDKTDYDYTTGGTHWIFSINLRRLNANDYADINDTILSIKLPYKLMLSETTYAFDSIKFSTKPRYSTKDTLRLKYREDRGFSLIDTTTNQNYFVITNKMLPDKNFINTTGRQDITINAAFICNGLDTTNPLIQVKDGEKGIDNIDIEIKYHGKVNVGINYCRIATPNGYDFLVGKQDSLIQDWYQRHINIIQNCGYEIYGVYGRDEFPEEYFLEQRYKSKLFNFCTVSEGAGGNNIDHYLYHVDPMYIWGPSGHIREYIHAPYIATFSDDTPFIKMYRMSFGGGYIGYRTHNILNSSYEMDMANHSDWKKFRKPVLDSVDFRTYFYSMLGNGTTLPYIEYSTFTRFYTKPGFLYNNNNVWMNNFPVGNWGVRNAYAKIGNARPQTGEEVRWLLWLNLCMGAKGLLYDARCDSLHYKLGVDSSDNSTVGFLYNRTQKGKFDNMPFDSLIFSDDPAFGSDFIPVIDSASYIHNYVNFDSSGKYLGVPNERIFYGRKSPKIEMYYLHNWIRANDSILMNLRLVSAFSKGYRIWKHSDTARYSDTIMKKYVRLDNRLIIYKNNDSNETLVSDIGIKTRPINRTIDGASYYEPYDSSFFDITLHRTKEDVDLLSNKFVLGILNKRTDPLVYFTEDTSDSHILFMTPSEYLERCQFGGKNPLRPNGPLYSDSVWKTYYWKRLACREITIPMAFKKEIYNNGLYSLTVKELGVDNYDNLSIWYSEPYYHRIDTVIPIDGSIVSKHLPGQGKMIEVTKNSVFNESGSQCEVCDLINNFEDFNINIISINQNSDKCCYRIEFTNNTNCDFGILPVKLIAKNTENIQFNNELFNGLINSPKTYTTTYDASNIGVTTFSELCIGESTESTELEIVFGSDLNGNFYGCNRKFKYILDCRSDTLNNDTMKVENCCDLFSVSSYLIPVSEDISGGIASSCTRILIDNYKINDCIKSISMEINGKKTDITGTEVSEIFSKVGLDSLINICYPLYPCGGDSSILFSFDQDIIFRGIDGEILCTKAIPIYYYCAGISYTYYTTKKMATENPKGSEPEMILTQNNIGLEFKPNPNYGNTVLIIKSEKEFIANIKILSLTGEILKEYENIKITSNYKEIEFDFSDFCAGTYNLVLESEKSTRTIKFIKLK